MNKNPTFDMYQSNPNTFIFMYNITSNLVFSFTEILMNDHIIVIYNNKLDLYTQIKIHL